MNNIANNRIMLVMNMNGWVTENTHRAALHRKYIKNLSKLLERHLFLDVVIAINSQQLPEVEKLMESFDETISYRVTSRIMDAECITSSIGVISGWYSQMKESYKDWLLIAHGYTSGKNILRMNPENGFSDEDYFALIKKLIILRLK